MLVFKNVEVFVAAPYFLEAVHIKLADEAHVVGMCEVN